MYGPCSLRSTHARAAWPMHTQQHPCMAHAHSGAPMHGPCTLRSTYAHLILASWQALMLAKMLPGSQVDSPANRTSTSRWP